MADRIAPVCGCMTSNKIIRGMCRKHFEAWRVHNPSEGRPPTERELKRQEREERGVKLCARCSTEKPFDCFTVDRRRRDGRNPYCRTCIASHTSSDACKAQRMKARKARVEADPLYERKWNLRRLYNITIEQYVAMLDEQGGGCKICHEPPGDKSLHVDHDHRCCPVGRSCGKCVRALLCARCNTAVGWLETFGAQWWTAVSDYVS